MFCIIRAKNTIRPEDIFNAFQTSFFVCVMTGRSSRKTDGWVAAIVFFIYSLLIRFASLAPIGYYIASM